MGQRRADNKLRDQIARPGAAPQRALSRAEKLGPGMPESQASLGEVLSTLMKRAPRKETKR